VHTVWRLAAVAVVVLGITAVTSTLTTAYLTRPPATEASRMVAPVTPAAPAMRRAALVEVARPRPLPARAISAPVPTAAPAVLPAAVPAATEAGEPAAHAPVASPEPTVASAPTPAAAPRAASADPEPVAASTVPAAAPAPVPAAAPTSTPPTTDCAAGDRTWKIAKPGLIGTAVGAGLGAAGGAIASGGKGAGQGAIIGGLAGAALGSGYGAYRTKNECGAVFGSPQKLSDSRAKAPAVHRGTPVIAEHDAPVTARAGEAPFAAHGSERITIYHAR
jgi:hypothetical protein